MKRILVTLVLCAAAAGAYAQGPKDIRINEFMVVNQTNYEDDYGHRIGWIELHNTGHSKVDVAGCYLTVTQGDKLAGYRIPAHDSRTVIEPLGYLVFFCDGTDTKGTFHTNFTLDRTGYIAFMDASSKGEPISQVEYTVADQEPDVSMGYETVDGELVFQKLTRTTPMATNDIANPVPKHELFRQMDPSGGLLAITAMAVVFSALLVLFLLFNALGKVMQRMAASRKQSDKSAELLATAPKSNKTMGGEAEVVAITLALHQFQSELHDRQSTILTINRVARAYSPWSSKIYGLRQIPNKK